MSVTKEVFGKLSDGREVLIYTIRTGRLCAKVTDLGAVLVSLYTPDRNGEMKDICLGSRRSAPTPTGSRGLRS